MHPVSTSSGEHKYYPAVDGLRALAVLLVVFYHLDPSLVPSGFVGVDVFFVISGFVVTRSVLPLRGRGFGGLLLTFYSRRAARIIPALIVCVTVMAVLTQMFIPQSWLSKTGSYTALASIAGLSNLLLVLTRDEYFAPTAEFNPFIHTWSLGVEEQFYLIFPTLLVAGWALSARMMKPGRDLLLIGALSALSLAACAVATPLFNKFAFYMLPTRFWELGIGAVLALTLDSWKPVLARYAGPVGCLAAVLMGIGALFADRAQFPFPWALAPAMGAAGMIAAVVSAPASLHARFWALGPVVFVGHLSYSLYLWHWPVFVLGRWTVGLESVPVKVLALVIALGGAYASYRWIELPIRAAARHRPSKPLLVLGSGLAASAAAMLVCLFVFLDPTKVISQSRTEAAEWRADANSGFEGPCMVAETKSRRGAAIYWKIEPTSCHGVTPAHTLFVVGDSHAPAYLSMLRDYARLSGYRVQIGTLAGCSPWDLNLPTEKLEPGCRAFAAEAARWLLEDVAPGDVVFLPALRVPRYADQWTGNHAETPEPTASTVEDHRRAEAETAAFAASLAARGGFVLLEGPKPVFPAPAFRCSDWFNRINAICRPGLSVSRAEIESRRERPLSALRRIAERRPDRVRIWDPTPLLCTPSRCDAIRHGRPLFFDGDHLSGYANQVLLPRFAAAMRTIPNQTLGD